MRPPLVPPTPSVFVALWLIVAVPVMSAVLLDWLAHRDHRTAAELQRARVNRLDARAAELEVRPAGVGREDLDLVEQRVGQCEAKLADVRQVLEVLIRTEQSTGRLRWNLERLPRPISDWPAWPCRGEMIGSITERRHPCDREGARP